MRLCIVSDLIVSDLVRGAASDAETLCNYTRAWARQGHDVYWLAPPDVLQESCLRAVVAEHAVESVPAICRYVIPLDAYKYEGVQLFCVPQEIWRRTDLHTRLFTFLRLLHRACPYEMLHVWGSVPVAYLTVYTARYLTVPAAVSPAKHFRMSDPQELFLWNWVVRHATALIVPHPSEEGHLAAEIMSCLGGEGAEAGQELITLYAHLLAAHHRRD